uniref:Uncharacterized protein n=1 Tax=Setaria digitata TaxID=48799 RepID=A0A915PHP1_9BILA
MFTMLIGVSFLEALGLVGNGIDVEALEFREKNYQGKSPMNSATECHKSRSNKAYGTGLELNNKTEIKLQLINIPQVCFREEMRMDLTVNLLVQELNAGGEIIFLVVNGFSSSDLSSTAEVFIGNGMNPTATIIGTTEQGRITK